MGLFLLTGIFTYPYPIFVMLIRERISPGLSNALDV